CVTGVQTCALPIFIRFLRSKEAPNASLLTDYLAGSNVVGEEFKWKNQAYQRLTPLLAQDALDLYHESGGDWPPKPGPALRALGGYGIGMWGLGVQTYRPRPPTGARSPGFSGGGGFGGRGFGGGNFGGGGFGR